jgi:uncharacterized membrane protein SpoIIM required for sporulation
VSLVVFLCGATLGYTSISREWAAESLGAGGTNVIYGGSLATILIQNLGTVMFLYSGVLTLGLTSILSVGMLSAFVGATMSVGISNVGGLQMMAHTGAYIPLEFGGCVVAAAAGLYPALTLLARVFNDNADTNVLGTYLNAVYTSLKVLGCAVALILTAAAIEATVIAVR